MRNLENISEVKKGQTGSGLLVEYDGHITDRKETVRQIKEDIDNNHKFVIPEHFVVSAVFQKYGIKNANGRIYPENILKREVEKYIEERVNNRCAIGALDHPSCVPGDTRILTENGWKNIKDVNVGDNIFTVNKNKEIEIKPIIRKIDEPYKGRMIHFKGRFIDVLTTPNHRFPLLDRNQKWKGFYTAQEILENKVPDQSHCYFFKNEEWYDNAENKHNMHLSMCSHNKIIVLNTESLTITEEEYDDRVYCVEVENHTFYMMCNNGKCLWTGNSSCLSGHDVAHNILSLEWVGHTLVGDMELHLSPGYIKYGVCSTSGDLVANMLLCNYSIGVSSRALGSVQQKFGNLVVGDDLSLVCFDVVIEPSTPGAMIRNSREELKTFFENAENKGKYLTEEKISNIEKLLF